MSKKVKTALRVAVLVLVSLVLGINVYLWNARSLTGNALPMPFGYGAALVLTDVKGVVLGWVSGVGPMVRLLKSPWVTLALVAGAVLMTEGSFRAQKKKDQDEIEKIKEEIRRLKDGESGTTEDMTP